MEDALRGNGHIFFACGQAVLILVLMEDALREECLYDDALHNIKS